MAGRRLLDAAKLLGASRSVASQHLALRSQQFDNYAKTSGLVKAVKSQTDRATITAQAAIALARRLSEDVPKYNSPTERWSPGDDKFSATSYSGAESEKGATRAGEGLDALKQDHHYDRDQANGPLQPASEEEMEVTQEEAHKKPLPDGTIPPDKNELERPPPPDEILGTKEEHKELNPDEARHLQRKFEGQIPRVFAADAVGRETIENRDLNATTFSKRTAHDTTSYSSLPRAKVPKHSGAVQGSDIHVDDARLNQDVFYSPRSDQADSQVQEEEIPEDVNIDVFHNPRISKMLGGPEKKGYGLSMDRSTNPTPSRAQPEATTKQEMQDLAKDIAEETSSLPDAAEPVSLPAAATSYKDADELTAWTQSTPPQDAYKLHESRVPSSRFGRLWQFAGLGSNMAFGAIGESVSRAFGGSGTGSLLLSPGNLERLVTKLSRMRGAALKLGQMISFQDLKMLPPPIHEVLQRVQDSADYMPASQRNKVLSSNLGADWQSLFSSFDDVPLAAASIGQVHRATLASTGQEVAVKVQYPGVSQSIDSDLSNLSLLLTASRLLPKGLFLDKTIANARTELAWECDYEREAECCERFRTLLADDDAFVVPKVIREASGKSVLTAELMHGKAVTKIGAQGKLSQEQRDWIGTKILRLCLREMTEFSFMQTDPNWTNFLYNPRTSKLELLDFGASRDYPDKFLTPYLRTLIAASHGDRDSVQEYSRELGYLTGSESATMAKAHVDSVMTLSEPFARSAPEIYDFTGQTITDRVRSVIPIMVRERLAPPPEETYSLHRKLSGAFLLCARLGARVPCRGLFEDAIARWEKAQGAA